MKLVASTADLNLKDSTKRLVLKTLGQFTGLQQQVSFLVRSRYGPRFVIGGVELTGVHQLQGRRKPRGVSPYHIGGVGLIPEESVIRCVGETLERYAQLVAEISKQHTIDFASYDDMRRRDEDIVSQAVLEPFTPIQHAQPQFPFARAESHQPLGWIKARSLVHERHVWVPAQMLLVGYAAKKDQGEQRIGAGVTTGSAAHILRDHALRNALLELIQIDSAMGHWYSGAPAYAIVNDSRTATIEQIIERHCHPLGPQIEFFWIPNPDMPGFTIACLIKQERFPVVAAGLGIDLGLNRAMYKALLEATGVAGLSKVALIEACTSDDDKWADPRIDINGMHDLDVNVLYFALPGRAAKAVEGRFGKAQPLFASELPPDDRRSCQEHIDVIVRAFADTGKELVLLDLTTPDLRELGFCAVRAWSPDLLPLSLPSAPTLNHQRFKAYKGPMDNGPHPYA
jgi:ribosomal protein S12 methylthiotransferase accessory factor